MALEIIRHIAEKVFERTPSLVNNIERDLIIPILEEFVAIPSNYTIYHISGLSRRQKTYRCYFTLYEHTSRIILYMYANIYEDNSVYSTVCKKNTYNIDKKLIKYNNLLKSFK
jgi:hypothetical protein